MNDLDDLANSSLTDGWPTEPNGRADGSVTEPAPAPPGGSASEPPTQAPPSEPAPSAAPAGSASEPVPGVTADLRYCSRCDAQVVAVGKGRCPTCKSFLKGNTVPVKHPANVAKRDAILADLVAEYQPSTTMERSGCELLASTLERLASTRPGSTEWSRLMNASQTLSTSLRTNAPIEAATAYENYTLAQLVTRAEQLLVESRRIASRPRPAPFVPPPPTPRPPSALDPPVSTETIPQCAYGCGSLEHCAKVKVENPEAWAAIHFHDPCEVARRSREATRVMFANPGHHPFEL
jgi:hypothetical protein